MAACDQDEFLAILPLFGESGFLRRSSSSSSTRAGADNGGTIDGGEFVSFMRTCNPMDTDSPDGWRAFLGERRAL